jgi:quercetin dioxygenase-like cupin family protein
MARDSNNRGGSNTSDERQAYLLEAMVDGLAAAELTESRCRALRKRVLAAAAESPPALTETVRGPSVPWQPAWEGVWLRVLRRDSSRNLQVTLLRIEPGGCLPAHAHTKEEECTVLEGEVLIGTHRLRKGDFHLVHPGARHPDITSPTGALLLVRSEIPSFTGFAAE